MESRNPNGPAAAVPPTALGLPAETGERVGPFRSP